MTSRSILLAGIAILAISGSANAGQGYYAGLNLGWARQGSLDISNGGALPPATGNSQNMGFGDSFNYSGVFGYQLENLRLELEYTAARFSAAGKADSGDVRSGIIYVNANYDIPLDNEFAFMIGGGIGAANTHVDVVNNNAETINGSNGSFAWQLLTGIVWHAAPQLDLQLDYRYRGLGDVTPNGKVNVHTGATMTTVSGPVDMGSLEEQAFMVGLRWYFMQ